MFLPFGEWLPDMPDYANPGSSKMVNVLPRTQQSYGPMPSLSAYSANGLALRCQGAFSSIDTTDTIRIWAADQTNLYLLNGATWNAVSKAASPYNCQASDFWSFAQFGQYIYASNVSDPMQSYNLGVSTTFADVGGGAPKAKYLAVVRDFLIAAFTFDAVSGTSPQRVWWSAINNPASWPTPGTSAALSVQSDYQDIAGNQGWLQGIVSGLGYADAAVFFERAIYRMQYIGQPSIFAILPAEGARGTPAPQSIVQQGSVVYYLGEDGFYAFDGASSVPIGVNKVDKFFFSDVDQNYMGRIVGAIDPINHLIFWVYASINSSNGTMDRMVVYNSAVQRWGYISGISCEYICRLLSAGYTLETLSAVFPNLELVPSSLDSRLWTGGKIILGGFDPTHILGFFTGSALAGQMETSETQLSQDARTMVWDTRPIIDGDTPTVAIAARETPRDAVTYKPAVTVNSFGTCPQHVSGRYHRALMTTTAGGAWQHAQGVEFSTTRLGRR